jgi:hypothetical protein
VSPVRRRIVAALGLATAALAGACLDPAADGVGTDVVVPGASFKPGPLPGIVEGSGDGSGLPVVTAFESPGGFILPGDLARSFSGRTDPDAWAVGLAFNDALGDGYWVKPVGSPDPTNNGERLFSFSADFSTEIEPGLQDVTVVAFDADGRPGLQRSSTFCVPSPIPDNFNVCRATAKPPDTVISLGWELPADVDLVVITPDGKQVSPKAPSTVAAVGSAGVPADALRADGVGRIDRDAGVGCTNAGVRRENLVFATPPAPGRYRVMATLEAPCGSSAVRARATVRFSKRVDETTWTTETFYERDVVLTRSLEPGQPTFLFDIQL